MRRRTAVFSDAKKREIKTAQAKFIEKYSPAIIAEYARRNLFFFMRVFWDVITHDEPIWNWHLPYLSRELEQMARRVSEGKRRENDIIINVSPGTTKSTLCSVMFPAWCWVNWYWMRFIFASYSGALSMEHGENCRDIIRSDKFKYFFPEYRIKQDKDTKSNFVIMKKIRGKWKRGGNRLSTSVGGTVTGFHGHILGVDDPVDPERAVSVTEIKTANRWISQTLSMRAIDKAVTPMLLIMQRLAQDDPTGHILDLRPESVKHICLPGERKNFEKNVQPSELKEFYQDGLFDPVRMDWTTLKDLEKRLGQYGYAAQIGQSPTPPGGNLFKVDNFIIQTTPPPPNKIETIVRYWDKAGTQDKPGGVSKNSGSRTAGLKMAKLTDGHFIVLDAKFGRWSSEEREKIIRRTAEADGSEVIQAIEQEGGSGGKESAEATTRRLAGFSVVRDRPTGNKSQRADTFSVQVNDGNVQLLRAEWNSEFKEEYRYFPFGLRDDLVDAGSGAFRELTKLKEAGPIF